jgi:hypothetical protein
MKKFISSNFVRVPLLGCVFYVSMLSCSPRELGITGAGAALILLGFSFLFGVVAYLLLRGDSMLRMLITAVVVIAALLVFEQGGDPSIPGVHNVAIAVMTAFSVFGAATAGALRNKWGVDKRE